MSLDAALDESRGARSDRRRIEPAHGRALAYVALASAGFFWSLGFPLGKLALRETSAPQMILLRFAMAAMLAAPFAFRREALPLWRSPAVVLAGLFYGLGFLVQYQGLTQTSVAVAALLIGAMPALIAVAARVLGERVPPATWAGVAAATLGAAAIAGNPVGESSQVGIGLVIASLVLFLGWQVSLKRAPSSSSPLAVPAITILVATCTVLAVAVPIRGFALPSLSPIA